MPSLLDRIAGAIARTHALRIYRRFLRDLDRFDAVQQRAWERVRRLVGESEFGRRYGLARVRTVAELRRATPLHTFEDLRPYVERVCDGDVGALFRPRQRILMFATSSGTTARTKLVPVTPEFVQDYRRGWNTFGVKMLTDHRGAFLRPILQSSSRHDERYTPAGVPVGAISGLMAQLQKGIVRRYYVGRPEITRLRDPRARYYALLRFAITRDVSFALTANPATLIRIARTGDEESERLIRDVRDGTLDASIVDDGAIRSALQARLVPEPETARRLEHVRCRTGRLAPRDYWRLSFVACWIGGSMAHYLTTLQHWWGDIPVRDIGLLASEGRVTIPLEDFKPQGPLDATAGVFEFIPAEQFDRPQPETVGPRELEPGQKYAVVLTNTTGLVRYRLDDIVRMHGWVGQSPVLEFLHRGGKVSSLAGEKLTENQVVAAMVATVAKLNLSYFDYLVAPQWTDPPSYRVSAAASLPSEFAEAFDSALKDQNEEYASRRSTARLGPVVVRSVDRDRILMLDKKLLAERSSTMDQYKRPVLILEPGGDDSSLGFTEYETVPVIPSR